MAAVTVATGYPVRTVQGNKRVVIAKLTAPADGDTWVTGLTTIEDVQITYDGATIAAADAVGVNTLSGGTITFEVVGTARDLRVQVTGY